MASQRVPPTRASSGSSAPRGATHFFMKIGSGGRRGRFFAEIDLMTSGPPELLLEWARIRFVENWSARLERVTSPTR